MAIRNLRFQGDKILRKEARRVDKITDRIKILIDDMVETMEENNGIGLAAPQVGVLRRVIVLKVGEGPLYKLINPEIIEKEGEVTGVEGCLSVPGVYGEVKRPQKVVVEALNENGEIITIVGEDLLARCLSHEIDHLKGVLFIDKVIRYVDPEELEKEKEDSQEEVVSDI